MFIAEVFHSIQGEGRLAGTPSVFVRTSGCNLRCWFCDTPYTSWDPEGEHRSVDELIDQIVRFDCRHVVLTGGEPMLAKELISLAGKLQERACHVTIETAGTVDLAVPCDLMSVSPKLSNSTPNAAHRPEGGDGWAGRHDERRHRPEVIRQLTSEYDYQLKFVIDVPDNVAEVEQYLREFPSVAPDRIYLMPQATDARTLEEKTEWLADLAERRRWQVSPRLHVERWGNRRGV